MKIRIRLKAFAAVLLATAPALAQAAPNDTIKLVLAKGAVLAADGQNYEFASRPDGSYTDTAGAPMGTYRVDGGTLCITPAIYGREVCFPIPEGKHSGDKFESVNQHGFAATITIR